MTDGLKIMSIGGSTYPYILVGWVEHTRGDEYIVRGARCIRRLGRGQSLAGLAAHGPYAGEGPTQLLAAATEELHRLLIRRAIPASEEAWAVECPRP